ncbi:bifunctional cytidylate kinase/GTPase Der [Gleimia sp. 6138-11-ORH1]|uniref:bifunctional cytidylate kinase/GTPase Der n=1 Tax=Gleimia sp. 6138-11-ORH1 TaxID=2973937 RepID=UPI002166E023|nr:bifunctional cytidylate kinase/GTPase Der [Gleimia sp. 6138-11-ORH1]MCS4484337.1 bifunctional cytidylate kinase/GTPase Der [Gleimia sp. 6138-11-ORH1]
MSYVEKLPQLKALVAEHGLSVAIDGPSGSGKSTLARQLASDLEIGYLDTGAMYRALTWYCLKNDLPVDDHDAAAGAADSFPLLMGNDPTDTRVFVGATDVTEAIRSKEISENVSAIATNLAVRETMRRLQREIIEKAVKSGSGMVAEGRDITTIVAPDADLRILVTASEEARLARRAAQQTGEITEAALADTKKQVLERDAKDSTVVNFTSAASGVVEVDTSSQTVTETMEVIYQLVAQTLAAKETAAQAADARTRTMRNALAEYDLTAEDEALLSGDYSELGETEPETALPVLAIVGRPNVGKSTLVNRILERRAAVVQDTPGVTRDRVSYPAHWAGRDFTLVDTGGWETDVKGLDKSVADQAELAIEMADAVIFVIDATVGATKTDEQLVRVLRRSKKPILLVANKVDSINQEADAAYLWGLGLGEPIPVSALHGRGAGDLLDRAMEILPLESAVAEPLPKDGPRRIALIGRPNVGKSSLLNKLAGSERVVVNDLAGTTRDPVDELIEIEGRPWWFVDTAGVRRKMHRTSGADYYASIRTQAALEKAELALVLLDASEKMTEQDVRVIQQAIDAGRAVVIVNNKWDLVDEDRQAQLRAEHERELKQIQWAPRINLSAKTGWHTNRLVRAIDEALNGWQTRISTGRLNSFLGELVAAKPHPVRGGKQPRILFATQASTKPPRFVIFTTGFLDPAYRRYIERRLREEFGFQGTPIQISVRVREKRRK